MHETKLFLFQKLNDINEIIQSYQTKIVNLKRLLNDMIALEN